MCLPSVPGPVSALCARPCVCPLCPALCLPSVPGPVSALCARPCVCPRRGGHAGTAPTRCGSRLLRDHPCPPVGWLGTTPDGSATVGELPVSEICNLQSQICILIGITHVRASLEHPSRWNRKPLRAATERVNRRRRRGSQRGTRSVAARIDKAFPKESLHCPSLQCSSASTLKIRSTRRRMTRCCVSAGSMRRPASRPASSLPVRRRACSALVGGRTYWMRSNNMRSATTATTGTWLCRRLAARQTAPVSHSPPPPRRSRRARGPAIGRQGARRRSGR